MTQAQSQHTINIDEVFESLKGPLALMEDSQRRDQMQRFLDTARVYQERAVVDLISDVVAKVNEASGETRVRLEYQAREFRLSVETNTPEPETGDPMTRMDGDVEKVTIRLPKQLKDLIDQAVSDRGTSLNSWYVRPLARGAAHEMRHRRPEGAHRGPPMGRGGRGRRFGGRDRE